MRSSDSPEPSSKEKHKLGSSFDADALMNTLVCFPETIPVTDLISILFLPFPLCFQNNSVLTEL